MHKDDDSHPLPKALRHQIGCTAGCLLWVLSFIGEDKGGQPFSTAGLLLAPVITLVGVYFWWDYYTTQKGHGPKLPSLTTLLLNYTFRRHFIGKHILEYLTFCLLLWMIMTFVITSILSNSDAFVATQNYCESNREVLQKTGDIHYYGLLVFGDLPDLASGHLHFTIVGSKGNFNAHATLVQLDNVWRVQKFDLK